MTPTVSVILCTYNQADYLQQAIHSVLHQTYQDLELLIIDNGSTDGSDEIILEAAADPRIDYMLYVENGPMTQRLNATVRQARGQFISFLHGDDYYLPEKLSRQVNAFRLTDDHVGVVHGPSLRLWPNGDVTRHRNFDGEGMIFPRMLRENFTRGAVSSISPLIRRLVLAQYPFYDDLFVEGESMHLKYALSWKFHHLDEPLVVMREHDHNMGKAIVPNTLVALRCLDKLIQQPAFRFEWNGIVLDFRAELLARSAWAALRMGVDRELVSALISGGANYSWRGMAARFGSRLPPTWIHTLNSLRPAPQAKASWT